MAARPFFETLRDLRRGATLAELGEQLNELTAAVVSTGKPGTLTLKLRIEPTHAALIVRDEVKVQLPRGERSGTIFYATHEFNLSRTDPNQIPLPLRAVDNGEDASQPTQTTDEVIANEH